MQQPEFEALVQRMVQFAQRSPRAYRWRIYALAAFGFATLLLLVFALLALLVLSALLARHAAGVAIKLILVLGALLLVVLRALWVRMPPPEGEQLNRTQAPALFELLDRLRARLNTPAVHRVLIVDDFNAAVTQIPRLGLFGWHRNYLLLGLPLLRSLSVQQLEAVLAHELGHLSRGHARLGNWIYRLRSTWMRLEQALAQKPHWGSGAIRGYLHWYAPYFNACSFPLARQNEFEADATSAQLTSPEIAAQALTNINVLGHYLHERFWPAIQAGAQHTPQPAFGPFSAYRVPGLQEAAPVDTTRWLELALARPTTFDDTHPCLKERLQALGAEAQLALPAAGTAADQLLGALSESLAGRFDERWKVRIEPSWKQAYERAQKGRARLMQLREQGTAAPLATSDTLELARLEEELGTGKERALELRRDLVERDPQSAPARFALARQLLLNSDESGVALMEAVIDSEPDAILPGSQLLHQYWARRGHPGQAQRWQQRASERAQSIDQAKHERNAIEPGDVWLLHGLDESALQALVESLRQIEGLRSAYLVRKRVTHAPDRPLYVLGTRLKAGVARSVVLEQLRSQGKFPGETLLVDMSAPSPRLGRELRALEGARIL